MGDRIDFGNGTNPNRQFPKHGSLPVARKSTQHPGEHGSWPVARQAQQRNPRQKKKERKKVCPKPTKPLLYYYRAILLLFAHVQFASYICGATWRYAWCRVARLSFPLRQQPLASRGWHHLLPSHFCCGVLQAQHIPSNTVSALSDFGCVNGARHTIALALRAPFPLELSVPVPHLYPSAPYATRIK